MSSNGLPPERKNIDATSPPPPKLQSPSERRPVRVSKDSALDTLFGFALLGTVFGSSRSEK